MKRHVRFRGPKLGPTPLRHKPAAEPDSFVRFEGASPSNEARAVRIERNVSDARLRELGFLE